MQPSKSGRNYLHGIALTLPDKASSDLPMAEAHRGHLEVGDSEDGSDVTEGAPLSGARSRFK
jgi:hypothetical protein